MRAQKAQDDDEWQAGDEDYYDDDYEQSAQHKPRYAKKRTLNRWNVDQDQYILLALVEVCGFQGLELPWAQVGQQCDPVLTEQSIKQHLAKTRTVRERSGFPCPPRLERARVIPKRAINRKPTGASLLPPPEQNRKNKKRGNTSIEPVEPPKKRSRASTAPEVEQLKPIGPLNAISGFHVGSAQHETYLCNEADNFSNITAATTPQSADFMGSSYAFDFDPKRYEGITLDLHQSMVYDAADRLMQANHYPGDEQVRAAAKKAGLGSDAQERFEMKQLQYPVKYAPPANAAAREPAPAPKAPVAPMYAGQNAPTGSLQSTAVHMDAALPRSLTWPSLSGGQPAVTIDDLKANSAPIPQLNWSPSEYHYVPSSQPVSAPIDLNAFLASAPRKHTGAGYGLYSGMTGLVTPPSDSLNASQLATPTLSLNNSQQFGIDHGPSLDHVKVDGHSDLKDEVIPATYDFGSFIDDHSQPVNDDGVFNDLVQFGDGEDIFDNSMPAHNPCDPLTWG